jgi:molybdopterin-guanine dinucleotide biosynthesis protein A
MGGLAAALAYAEANGFDEVLAAPCDLLGIPADCADRLAPAPAVAEGQWLLGLWPVGCAAALAKLLAAEGAVSARRWADAAGAVAQPVLGLRNINRPEQLGP